MAIVRHIRDFLLTLENRLSNHEFKVHNCLSGVVSITRKCVSLICKFLNNKFKLFANDGALNVTRP